MYAVLNILSASNNTSYHYTPNPFILITHAYNDFYQNHLAILSFIESIQDVDTIRDQVTNKTLLHWAASVGEINSIAVLLDKGADVNAKDNDNKTVLHYAVENKQFHAVQFLLAQKNLNTVVFYDALIGLLAHEEEQETLNQVLFQPDEWLLSKMRSNSYKVRHLAMLHKSFGENKQGGAHVIRYFNRVKQVDPYSIILDAFEEKRRILNDIKHRIAACPNVNAICAPSNVFLKDTKEHLLHWAAQQDACVIIKMLIRQNINLDIKDSQGESALDYAIRGHAIEAIDLLLKKGCAVHSKTLLNIMQIPLLSAQKEFYGEDFPYWKQVLLREIITFLTQKGGININAQDELGNTVLHRLAMTANIELMQCCLDHNANLQIMNYQNKTPLQMAQSRQPAIIQMIHYLIEQNAITHSMHARDSKFLSLNQVLFQLCGSTASPAPQEDGIVAQAHAKYR